MKRFNLYIICCLLSCIACKKDWLEASPDKALVIPKEPKDYLALLDETSQDLMVDMTTGGELSTTDFYLQTPTWQGLSNENEKNIYIWAQDIFGNRLSDDWTLAYRRIFQFNVVLDGIEKVQRTNVNAADWDNAKGIALFKRAFDFFHLMQVFAKPYQAGTNPSDLGVPMRLTSNVHEVSFRPSIKENYDQIIHDLEVALPLLSVTPLYSTRASKPAVFALFARIYLAIEDYDKAKANADSCLKYSSMLIDYNSLDPSAANPVPVVNNEVIYYTVLGNYISFRSNRMVINPELYSYYEVNDLRKSIFFGTNNGNLYFKGSLTGTLRFFAGLATDEMYLIRAESNARAGNITEALSDLNTLRAKRWKAGTYSSLSSNDATVVLKMVLDERRKELCFRGLRWMDLRRLNKDPQFAVTLTRTVNGQTYTLPPNDLRYVFPIPQEEIERYGLQQNPR